jgi:hypothetical protein
VIGTAEKPKPNGAAEPVGPPREASWTQIPSSPGETGVRTETDFVVEVRYDLISVHELASTPAVSQLYQSHDASAEVRTLQRAIELLQEALDHAEAALAALLEFHAVQADDEMQHVQALLPELFCLRTLGDGFGATINSLAVAFDNLQGIPLDGAQATAVTRALRRLRQVPFLAFDDAVDLIQRMADAQLPVDPPGLGALAELSSE